MPYEVDGVVASGKGAPVSVQRITVPDPGPGIQYAAPLKFDFAAAEYWIARSSRAMTAWFVAYL